MARCNATTKAGRRCSAAAMKGGNGKCIFHASTTARRRHLKEFASKYNRRK